MKGWDPMPADAGRILDLVGPHTLLPAQTIHGPPDSGLRNLVEAVCDQALAGGDRGDAADQHWWLDPPDDPAWPFTAERLAEILHLDLPHIRRALRRRWQDKRVLRPRDVRLGVIVPSAARELRDQESRSVSIYLDRSEYTLLATAARASARSVAGFVRRLILAHGRPVRELTPVPIAHPCLARTWLRPDEHRQLRTYAPQGRLSPWGRSVVMGWIAAGQPAVPASEEDDLRKIRGRTAAHARR